MGSSPPIAIVRDSVGPWKKTNNDLVECTCPTLRGNCDSMGDIRDVGSNVTVRRVAAVRVICRPRRPIAACCTCSLISSRTTPPNTDRTPMVSRRSTWSLDIHRRCHRSFTECHCVRGFPPPTDNVNSIDFHLSVDFHSQPIVPHRIHLYI